MPSGQSRRAEARRGPQTRVHLFLRVLHLRKWQMVGDRGNSTQPCPAVVVLMPVCKMDGLHAVRLAFLGSAVRSRCNRERWCGLWAIAMKQVSRWVEPGQSRFRRRQRLCPSSERLQTLRVWRPINPNDHSAGQEAMNRISRPVKVKLQIDRYERVTSGDGFEIPSEVIYTAYG